MVKTILAVTVCIPFYCSPALADKQWLEDEQEAISYIPQFRFHYHGLQRNPAYSDSSPFDASFLNPTFVSDFSSDNKRNTSGISQYDATLYYPFVNGSMTLDLGVNIKYLNVTSTLIEQGEKKVRNFREAIPMIYATALYDLPFKGLSAGIEGKHLDFENTYAFDYKAKLSYQWDGNLGLEGGWQHQQFSLDNSDANTAEFESKGLFLDLFMQF